MTWRTSIKASAAGRWTVAPRKAQQISPKPRTWPKDIAREIGTTQSLRLCAGVIGRRDATHRRLGRRPIAEHVGAKRPPAARHAVPQPLGVGGQRADQRDQTDHDRRDAEAEGALTVE